MMMVNIPLNLFNVFLASAEQQSFKAAGEKLCLTTSAVSQSIKKLEDLLGVLLFHRKTNAVELTPSGVELLEYVKVGINEIEKGIQHITKQNDTISIFCPPGIASELLSPFMFKIIAEGFQNIRIESNEQFSYNTYSQYDLAIILDETEKQAKNTLYLGPDYYFPFCHKTIYDQINSIDDLYKVFLFHHDFSRISWKEWFAYNDITYTPQKTLTFTRAAQLLSSVDNGLGVGLESSRLLARKLVSGDYRLCNLPNLKPVKKDITWLYINPNKKENKQILFLRDLVLEYCSTDIEGRLKCLG
ncbi:LysR family transcriptional regulator [Commensalibacter communis]|uniref:LysR family transcriptional regulator n=1 Tax=Commensalibacter communis TaxID=2972786 RepID=UPI00232F87E0|nr:LysR family transcriptional regulator [Commensalibacter communis]